MGPNRRCCVPGCKGGYDSQKRRNKELGIRNKSLFQAKNAAQMQKWRRVIPRLDREFSERDVVCEDHFAEGSITRYNVIKLKDGSIVKWPRGIPELKPDAYPTIFPNCPKYLTTKVTVLKPPMERPSTAVLQPRDTGGNDGSGVSVTLFDNLYLLAEEAGKEAPLNVSLTVEPIANSTELAPVDEPGEAAPLADSLLDLSEIVDGIRDIPLPGPNWATAVVSNCAVFLSVGLSFQCEKTVVISESSALLKLKVLFHGREVSIPGYKIVKLDDVSRLLYDVQGFQVCAGLFAQAVSGERLGAKCLGFVAQNPNRKRGRGPGIWCACCKAERKLIADRTRRREKAGMKRASKVRNALKMCRIRTTRLQCKVNKLTLKMVAMKRECGGLTEEIFALERKALVYL